MAANLKHSKRARGNYTKQIAGQLAFLIGQLARKEAGIQQTMKWWKYKGLRPFLIVQKKRQEKLLKKTKKDIRNMRMRINKLEKAGKINKIPF